MLLLEIAPHKKELACRRKVAFVGLAEVT